MVTPGVTADRGLRRAWPSCPLPFYRRGVSTRGVAGYPARVPDVRLSPLVGESRAAVECCELQWWFAVPQVGEQTRAAWYDRDTGELTRRPRNRPLTRAWGTGRLLSTSMSEIASSTAH